jgi:hypothetical protein
METGPTHALLDATDSGEEGDDGTFLGHAQMVPHECLTQVAFNQSVQGICRPPRRINRHRRGGVN